jgi:hypothetical protein
MFDKKLYLLFLAALFILGGCMASQKGAGLKAVYRINCGSEKDYKDKNGNVWSSDPQGAKKGGWSENIGLIVSRHGDFEIHNTEDPTLYRTEKYGAMEYKFKVKNGTYKVVLHFAETYVPIEEPEMRLFSVTINGTKVLNNFDVFKETGDKDIALVKEFPGINVTNGEININFLRDVEEPEVNAIEIHKE